MHFCVITKMKAMFLYCRKLINIEGLSSFDISYARIDGGANSGIPGYLTLKEW